MNIIAVLSLTHTSAASLPHGIHPQRSHMDALHSEQRLGFLKNAAPFSSFRTLDPTRMNVSEVLEAFNLIVSGQANNSRVLDFLLTLENIPHSPASSAVINSDNDDHDDEIQELPDPKTPVIRKSGLQVSFSGQPPTTPMCHLLSPCLENHCHFSI